MDKPPKEWNIWEACLISKEESDKYISSWVNLYKTHNDPKLRKYAFTFLKIFAPALAELIQHE